MAITKTQRDELVARASEVRRHAHAPYSHYAVGAALLGSSGRIYTGANVENAAYPTGMCAERAALFHAVSEGERQFAAIAIVTENAGMPCGACRQALSEFGLDTLVLIADTKGRLVRKASLAALLPQAFRPDHLPRG
jgi:cytidine deaminase